MNWIRKRIHKDETLVGTFLVLGSETVTEVIGQYGFDWVVIDLEHGTGGEGTLLHQMQSLSSSSAATIVRVPSHDPAHFKRALDLGASGIMVPWVNSAEEARAAVRATRYPPDGLRGLSSSVRAAGYGREFKDYLAAANRQVTTIIQVETVEAMEQIDQIAAVDGVDVLFVGPSDLSLSLGIYNNLKHRVFRTACTKIVRACEEHDKTAGILVKDPGGFAATAKEGFRFIALASDLAFLKTGIQQSLDKIKLNAKKSRER